MTGDQPVDASRFGLKVSHSMICQGLNYVPFPIQLDIFLDLLIVNNIPNGF
jgi:hypothetical protein